MGPEHNANFGNLYTYFIAQLVLSPLFYPFISLSVSYH